MKIFLLLLSVIFAIIAAAKLFTGNIPDAALATALAAANFSLFSHLDITSKLGCSQ